MMVWLNYSRNLATLVARRSSDTDDWAKYRSARNKAGFFLRSAKLEFFNSDFEENKNNVGAIWKKIKTHWNKEMYHSTCK